MTMKSRIAKLEKANGQGGRVSWDDFFKAGIDAEAWRAFLEGVLENDNLVIVEHGQRPEGERRTPKNTVVVYEQP